MHTYASLCTTLLEHIRTSRNQMLFVCCCTGTQQKECHFCLVSWIQDKITAIFQAIYSKSSFCKRKTVQLRVKLHTNLFPSVQINKPALLQTILHDEQVTNHYLKQCWCGLLAHIRITRIGYTTEIYRVVNVQFDSFSDFFYNIHMSTNMAMKLLQSNRNVYP